MESIVKKHYVSLRLLRTKLHIKTERTIKIKCFRKKMAHNFYFFCKKSLNRLVVSENNHNFAIEMVAKCRHIK